MAGTATMDYSSAEYPIEGRGIEEASILHGAMLLTVRPGREAATWTEASPTAVISKTMSPIGAVWTAIHEANNKWD